ncbi:MAG: SRPBCC family protein [Nocardioidaceae bacterium]
MTRWPGPRPVDYQFRTSWHLHAPRDTVFELLADVEHYPQWWPAVRRIEGVDEHTARASLRARLPYTLVCTLTRVAQDPDRGVLEVRLEGDLVGFARWTVTGTATGTSALYEQQVTTTTRAMRVLAPVARPLFRLNHRWMMRDGYAGLRRRLESRRPI